ncbi:glucokinase [Desulforhopalus sp. IMCC35007]|uniref:glucokinase n=1 Tax=Desulforhopalus sp. IMCC35007 TaxID=2569543 RepID=UPI00145EDDA0|nr:glucokinase [Desulforhopalus sp. IMCC35007]
MTNLIGDTTLLVADIGGTKSDFALFLPGNVTKPLYQQRYFNSSFSSVEEIIHKFLSTIQHVPSIACLAVAGLVGKGRAEMTNLAWTLDSVNLELQFGFTKVILINDLTAVARSIKHFSSNNFADIEIIQQGDPGGGAVSAVVAPGTGLGEGLIVESDGLLFVTGTEGGHADFAPVDEEQMALLAWVRKKQTPVSYEYLIAGPGIARLYDFCKSYYGMDESVHVAGEMSGKTDRTPAIIAGAIADKACPLCRRTVDLFLKILGSEAGNLALKTYALGGIYLGGGILPRLTGHVSFQGFIEQFLDKGQMSQLMKKIPVRLLLNKNAALIGGAGCLVEFLGKNGLNINDTRAS